MEIGIGKLKLSAQSALLGNVFPNLRAVSVNYKDNAIYVYFYHDNELSEDENELIEHTMDQVIADFCCDDKIEFVYDNKQVDYPKKLPSLNGHWVFYRYEDSSKYI